MANFAGPELAIAAIGAGAIGSLPCAMLDAEAVVAQAAAVRQAARGPLNLNFFSQSLGPQPDHAGWDAALSPFYEAEGVETPAAPPPPPRPLYQAQDAARVRARTPNITL